MKDAPDILENTKIGEVTEGIAIMSKFLSDDREVLLSFFNTDKKNWGDGKVESCLGDIIVIINALVDYADLVEKASKLWEGISNLQKYNFEYHANRCRKISYNLAEQINYDREAALEKCRNMKEKVRDNDVGEDGISALARRHYGENLEKAVPAKPPVKMAQLKIEF